MLDRKLDEAQLPYCERENIAVLAYSPLAQGLLTGKVTCDRALPEGDYRAEDARFCTENRERILAFLEQVRPVADEHQATLAQLVIAWTLARPGLSHALVGVRSAAQAGENAKAGDIVLAPEDLAQIDEALSRLELQV